MHIINKDTTYNFNYIICLFSVCITCENEIKNGMLNQLLNRNMSCFNVNIEYDGCSSHELCITLILYDKYVLNKPTNFENIKKVIHIYKRE